MSAKYRHYGVWFLKCHKGFEDKRVWKEGRAGYDEPTLFQKKIGVRYSRGEPRFPNSKGGYFGQSKHGPQRSMPAVFKGIFASGFLAKHRVSLRKEHSNFLARSTGHVILWAPGIRYVSVAGLARFVGKVFILERENEP